MKRDEDTIPAGEFKARCLKLMDEVSATKRSLVVTKRGKPVVTITPFRAKKDKKNLAYRGCAKGTVKILGDIIGPFHEEWGEVWNSPDA